MLTHTSSQSAAAEGRLTSSSPPTGNSTSSVDFFQFSSARRSRSAVRFLSRVSVLLLLSVIAAVLFSAPTVVFFFFSYQRLPPPLHVLSEPRPCESNWRYRYLRPINISFSSTSAVFISWRFLCGSRPGRWLVLR